MAQEVASIFARVGADLSDFHRGMGQFNSAIHGAGGMFRSFTTGIVQGIGQAFGQASMRAIRGFGEAITGAIADAASMEQGVADIRATMRLTADETDKLSKLISDLGIDPLLKVSAEGAADAIEMLGKNGLTLDEILKGAARSTVLLANSTGGDFSTSADIATSAMSQFKISAEGMADAVDQIVGVTQNGKIDIDDYRLAISQAGGVAASVGVEFDDFNAAIAAIAPLFSSGSDAGTSFKTFLQRLVPQSAEAADVMRDIGLYTGLTGKEFDAVQDKMIKVQQQIEDLDPASKNYNERMAEMSAELTVLQSQLMAGDSAFFDANGQMKSMSEIAQALQTAFSALSEEQKINASSTIFGTDAMRAAFALADSGAATIDKLKAAIGNTDAEEAAAIRTDTLAAKWEIFTDLLIEYRRQAIDPVKESFKGVLDQLSQLANEYGPKAVTWAQTMSSKIAALSEAGIALLKLGLAEGIGAIFAPAEDGTRQFDKLFVAMGMTTDEAKGLSERLIGTARVIMDTTSAVASLIGTIANIVSPMVTWIDKNIGLENALRGVALVMAGGFVASIVSTIATIVSAVGAVATFVASLTGLGSVATTIGGAVAAAISLMGGPITLLIAAIGALALAWSQNWWDIQGKTRAAWDAIKGFFADGVASIKNFFNGGWFEIGQNMVRGIVDGIRAGWTWVTDAAKGVADAALSTAKGALGIQSPSRAFMEVGRNIAAGISTGITAGRSAVEDSIFAVTRTLLDAWNQQTHDWRVSAMSQLKDIFGALREQFRLYEDATVSPTSDTSGLGISQIVALVNQMSHELRVKFVENLPDSIRQAILKAYQIFEDGSIGFRQATNAGGDIRALVERVNAMEHNARLAYVNNLAPDMRQTILQDYRIFEDGSIAPRRIEITVRGESNLPADRAKLRELARALQQEFVFTGARVAVT